MRSIVLSKPSSRDVNAIPNFLGCEGVPKTVQRDKISVQLKSNPWLLHNPNLKARRFVKHAPHTTWYQGNQFGANNFWSRFPSSRHPRSCCLTPKILRLLLTMPVFCYLFLKNVAYLLVVAVWTSRASIITLGVVIHRSFCMALKTENRMEVASLQCFHGKFQGRTSRCVRISHQILPP